MSLIVGGLLVLAERSSAYRRNHRLYATFGGTAVVPGADSGSVVIVGHVDSAAQGTGALFYLRILTASNRIELTGAQG